MALAPFTVRRPDPERPLIESGQSLLDSRPKLLKNTDC
jgi:hypothetical protein